MRYIDSAEFDKDLHRFASDHRGVRRVLLPEIVQKIDSYDCDLNPSKHKSDDIYPTTQLIWYRDYISKALGSNYAESGTNQGQKVFTGEAAVAVLSLTGWRIVEYENTFSPDGIVGEVHQDFGVGEDYTLLPFAYKKGVQRLHLELNQMPGGIVKRQNYDYLKSILEGHIYQGDAAYKGRNETIIIGVSGAQITPEFMKSLTGGEVSLHTNSFLAGMMDTLLAESIVSLLQDKNQETLLIPPHIGNLTRAH